MFEKHHVLQVIIPQWLITRLTFTGTSIDTKSNIVPLMKWEAYLKENTSGQEILSE